MTTTPVSVRVGFGSNVGHPPAMKTLWIFGAGASKHLGFPLSFDFFRQSLSLVTSKFKDPNPMSLAFGDVHKSDGTRATEADGRRVKTDPQFALEEIGMWAYMAPEDMKVLAAFQYLVNEWKRLRDLLHQSGLPMSVANILAQNPETLIASIWDLPDSGDERTTQAKKDAQECIIRIYFYTLSHFNEAARERIARQSRASLYDELVKSIDLEGEHRFISFNYDTMLDEAMFLHFAESWAYHGFDVSAINGYPVSSGTEPDVLYIKPHGSLNLTVCPNCKKAQIRWFWQIVPRGVNQQKGHNRRCVHCKEPLPGRRELVADLLVPPLFDKEAIEASKQAIEDAFAWADNVVSIGFSFPAQDAYFLDCMAKGLARNAHNTVKLHLVQRDGTETATLRDTLLAMKGLDVLRRRNIELVPTECEGFEGVKFGSQNYPV